jgi:hypothetical protein
VSGASGENASAGLKPRMKLLRRFRLEETKKKLNVEHRTLNIERPILMTLRFIGFKTSEPHNWVG